LTGQLDEAFNTLSNMNDQQHLSDIKALQAVIRLKQNRLEEAKTLAQHAISPEKTSEQTSPAARLAMSYVESLNLN